MPGILTLNTRLSLPEGHGSLRTRLLSYIIAKASQPTHFLKADLVPEEIRHDHVCLHSNDVSAFSNAICRGKYESSASHKIFFFWFLSILLRSIQYLQLIKMKNPAVYTLEILTPACVLLYFSI